MLRPDPARVDGDPIRVEIQQAALPEYRIPVFRELALRDNISISLHYGNLRDGPSNAEPVGFRTCHVPIKHGRLFGHPIYWHSPQWTAASGKTCDVLILSWDLHYASLVPALLRAKRNNVATILWGHGYSRNEAGWRKTLREQAARLATALLFYGRGAKQMYANSGWDGRRLHVALNSLDAAPMKRAERHWRQNIAELAAFRRNHDLGEGPVILFVSRLLARNRADLLLRASADLVSHGFGGLRVAIIGEGPDRRNIEDLARRLGLKDRLRMPGAIYDEMNLAPWFLCSDVFCYPANVGLSLLHAFNYGLPVVTSNRLSAHGPEIEALEDGRNGLLFEHEDSGSLAGVLGRIMSDDGFRHRLSEHARHVVDHHYSLANMVDGMEGAIRYCARKSRAAAT